MISEKLTIKGKNIVPQEEIELVKELNLSSLAEVKYGSIFTKRTKEHILLKHLYIYNEYIKVQREMQRLFPEIASFLPKKYFYLILSYRYSLTTNYVCAIIGDMRKRASSLKREMEDAKLKIANEEYNDYFRRE